MFSLRAIAFSSAAVVLTVWGCAAGSDDPIDPTGPGPSTTTSSTGGGGHGGEGGAGGAGGGGLCDQDCSAIMAPDCYMSVCNTGDYPGSIGACVVVPEADDTSCDDGLFCTIDDTCQAGMCTGGPPNDCGMVVDQCSQVACDEALKACSGIPAADGMDCMTSNLCTIGSTCQNGACVGGTFNDCFFSPVPDDCHIPLCNPLTGMCEPVVGNDGEPCTDQTDLCTVDKVCSSGQCIGGSPKDCSSLTQGCTLGVCDTVSGQCTATTVMDGQLCDDLDACTGGETCNLGSCGNGTPVTTCSQTADGCCPSSCSATTDYDCNCPGTFINGICVYVASKNAHTFSAAQSTCQGLGAGWDLCAPTMLCNPQTLTYIGTTGCNCNGGAAACSCGSAQNLYFHVTGGNSPFYVRTALVPNCNWAADACTQSGSETCGAALCCKP